MNNEYKNSIVKLMNYIYYAYKSSNRFCYTNTLLDKFCLTNKNVAKKVSEKVIHIIRWLISRYSVIKDFRFTDKSQVFIEKLSFINKILKKFNSKFLLESRNPYSICYRVASSDFYNKNKVSKKLSYEKKINLASKHWYNLIKRVLENSKLVGNFKIVKFVNLLKKPEDLLNDIYGFVEPFFKKKMVLQKEHRILFGSTRRKRWLSLRTDMN